MAQDARLIAQDYINTEWIFTTNQKTIEKNSKHWSSIIIQSEAVGSP